MTGVRNIFFLASIVFLVALEGSANALVTLSLKDAIDLALVQNEKLRQSGEDRQSAADRVKEVKGALFPKVEASYQYSRYFEIRDIPQYYNVTPNTTPGGGYAGLARPGEPLASDNPLGWHTVPLYGPAKEDHEHTAALSVTQMLYTSGRVMNYFQAAKTGSDAMESVYQSEKRDLALKVQEAYIDALLAKHALAIAGESLENSSNDYQIIKNKLDKGLASTFDAMQQEVVVQNFRVGLNNAENHFILAKNNLKTIIGVSLDEEIALTDDFMNEFPRFEFNRLMEDMTKNEPALRAITQQIEASEHLLKAKKADYFPVLAAFGAAEKSGDSMDFIPENDEFEDTLVAGVNLTIPIYEGGIKRSKVSQAAHDLKKSQLEHEKIGKLLRLDLQNAYLSYLSSQKELEMSEGTVKVAEKAYDLAKLRYHTGLGSRNDLEDASLSLSNARLLHYRFKRNVNYYLYKIYSYCPDQKRSMP